MRNKEYANFNQKVAWSWSVVVKSYFNLFNFTFYSKLGSEDAQAEFEKGLIICVFWGEMLELIASPTLVSCTCIYFLEKTKTETTRALPVKNYGAKILILLSLL